MTSVDRYVAHQRLTLGDLPLSSSILSISYLSITMSYNSSSAHRFSLAGLFLLFRWRIASSLLTFLHTLGRTTVPTFSPNSQFIASCPAPPAGGIHFSPRLVGGLPWRAMLSARSPSSDLDSGWRKDLFRVPRITISLWMTIWNARCMAAPTDT